MNDARNVRRPAKTSYATIGSRGTAPIVITTWPLPPTLSQSTTANAGLVATHRTPISEDQALGTRPASQYERTLPQKLWFHLAVNGK
jgi:hypothetical protein